MVIEQALSLLSQDLSLDLGTSNTLILSRGRVVVEEPSVVAVEKPGRVVAFGQEAKRMVGRTPEHIVAHRPVQEGVIVDYPLAEALLRACVERALSGRSLVRPRVIAAVSPALNESQRRAVADSARAAGCREVQLVSTLLAAGLGCGLPIQDPAGSLVADIGGGTTEIGVLSLGGVVSSATLPLAGNALDAAISTWIQEKHGLLVGERTAEEIKLAIGCAVPPAEPRTVQATGRDMRTGIPRELTLSSAEICQAFQPVLQRLFDLLQRTLSRTPPELAADIYEHGLVLCGGTALLPGLVDYLRERAGVPVLVAPDPVRAVVAGAGKLLGDAGLLERVAY